eukprot:gene4909-6872_t
MFLPKLLFYPSEHRDENFGKTWGNLLYRMVSSVLDLFSARQSNEQIERLALEVHQIWGRLRHVVVGINLTASEFSIARDTKLPRLLTELGICPVTDDDEVPFSAVKHPFLIRFNWKWRGVDERLMDKLLHETVLFNIRKANYFDDKSVVVYKGSVRGRTDIVILKVPDDGRTRIVVQFVIEIKTAIAMRNKFSGCLNEAVVQLLGLCGDNPHNSPSVVLTDLTVNILVVHLFCDRDGNPNFPYFIKVRRCACLNSAMHFANEVSENCISAHFCRPRTPTSSLDND